ncbi:MAG: sialate O-acetylesterase [Jejuia sp.]
MKKTIILVVAIFLTNVNIMVAQVSLPNFFSDHMVLQRNHKNPIWGTASKKENITIQIAGQTHTAKADENGKWKIYLNPLEAGGPHQLEVTGKNKIIINDVLIGEVWICSGQSNMQMTVKASNHSEVEIASANYSQIRLMNTMKIGGQIPKNNIDVEWQICSPKTVGEFSATAYFFGRRLHNTLGVPIGLISNAWGGSPIDGWIPKEVLRNDGHIELIEGFEKQIAGYSDAIFEQKKQEYKQWLDNGKPGKKKWPPEDLRTGRNRPGNIYNELVHPFIGYGIKGIIWCQGESNAARAYQYRELFPLMINTYREKWNQGDFPFYWVQMADFHDEVNQPKGGSWAELREAQTMTLALPNTGEVIVTDIGESRDIHPKDKQTAANRLVRHALAKDYGFDMACDSPRFSKMEIKNGKAIITFTKIDKGLYAFDVPKISGFAIAEADQKFVWAQAKIISKNQVEVWADSLENPVAVRFGFEQNPVVNLYDKNGLPVTPFRTDDWVGVTEGQKKAFKKY